jgi:hypothetical protein
MSIAFSQIDQVDSQVDAQIEGLNTAALACSGLSATDMTAWSGFYAAWKAIHKQWSTDKTISTFNPFIAGPVVLLWFSNDVYSQMNGYLQRLPDWQIKIHSVCPSYVAPPPIVVPPPPDPGALSTTDKLIEAARVASGAALAFGAGYAMFKIAQLVGDIRSSVKS